LGQTAELKVQDTDGGVVFKVKVVPAGSRTEICGILDGMLKIKVTSPAEKGKANQALINFLAQMLNVKKNQLSIISGQTSRVKQIRLLSMSAETLLKKLGLNK
jgi:uncharacterized protein (TIGR00251 family)